MTVDYESTQCLEIVSQWGDREVEFVIGLECTSPRTSSFSTLTGDYPSEDPEFNMVNIAYLDEEGNSVYLGIEQGDKFIKSFLGNGVYDLMIEAAYEDAVNNYHPGD